MNKVRLVATVFAFLTFSSAVFLLSTATQAAEPTEQTLEIYGGIIDEDHPLNSEDDFTEASTDEGLTWHPAYLVGGNHPWGNVAGTNSWLNCAPSFFECLGVRSDYRYRFFLAEGWSASSLTADMKIDNYGWISLNGTDISGVQAGSWNSGGPIAIDAMTHTGWNELHVVLVDQGGWAGINFHLTFTVISPEPIKVMKPGTPDTLDVIFDEEGGSQVFPKQVYTLGADPVNIPVPSRDGYIFKGWAKDSLTGLVIQPGSYVPDDNVTLHAVWEKVIVTEEKLEKLADTGEVYWPLLFVALLLLVTGSIFIKKSQQS